MPEKVMLSRLVLRVFGLLGLLTAGAVLFLMIYSQSVAGSEPALKHLSGVDFIIGHGLLILIVFLAFSLISLITASGLARREKWAWLTGLMVSVFLLPLIPLGTIFGLKMMFCLTSQDSRTWLQLLKPEVIKKKTS
ncbi:MAG: hypothetical protein H5U07_00620 [Candidatus Aminicenantes bacterium]|nr:hypothetical protein [Candidatus Aminicenantes bacterium]